MHHLTNALTLYSGIPQDSILRQLETLSRELEAGTLSREEAAARFRTALRRLLALAGEYGLRGNLWQGYLLLLLVQTRTPYGLAFERKPAADCSLQQLLAAELTALAPLFSYDLAGAGEALGVPEACLLADYVPPPGTPDGPLAALAAAVAGQADRLVTAIPRWIETQGCGDFGLFRAFRPSESGPMTFTPIPQVDPITLDELIGYDLQKAQLRANTAAFVAGKPFNHMLLYGDAGTGKSTSVRALLGEFMSQGLRLVEVDKNNLDRLSAVMDALRPRNYRFMIVLDDLSFDSGETGYKYLKAVIEGGIGARADNLMICATSNRRHLIRETWSDRNDMEHNDDIHRSDTVEEKLSLAARFGCAVNFSAPDRKLFRQIVRELAARHPEITLSEEALYAAANRWEIRHGGLSGRTARQFTDALAAGQI